MSPFVLAWLRAFVFTQLVELPIYRRVLRCPWRVAFGASALTHPIVWFGVFHPRVPLGYTEKLVLAELFAWLAEAAYFRCVLGPRRALVASFAANVASALLGALSRALIGLP